MMTEDERLEQIDVNVDWEFVKEMPSQTRTRHYHVKVNVDGKTDLKNKPIWEHFNINNSNMRCFVYKAKNNGRPITLSRSNLVLETYSDDWIDALEKLLKKLD